MAVKKKYPNLGRGLDALISTGEVSTSGSSSINEVDIHSIKANPNQPRREFDEEALEELAESIRQIGIIQPITLRQMEDGTYQIIAGERRWRASQRAGLDTIPAYVRTVNDEGMMQMALVENIQREDLNAVEIALAYQKLIEQYSLTQDALSEKVGKKRATIANYLRLLKLPCSGADGAEKARNRPRSCTRTTRTATTFTASEALQRHSREGLFRATSRRDGESPQCWRRCAFRSPHYQKFLPTGGTICPCARSFGYHVPNESGHDLQSWKGKYHHSFCQ